VFIVGCEDGLLPMLRDEGDDEAIEEERRLSKTVCGR
jgi:superfamily I DNA/RNA helicase